MRLGTVRIGGGSPTVVGAHADGDHVVDLVAAGHDLHLIGGTFPTSLLELLEFGDYGLRFVKDLDEAIARRGDLASAPWAFSLAGVTFLAPIPRPPKVVCINANRGNRPLNALDPDVQDEWPHPMFFLKAPTAVVGHGATIEAWDAMRPVQIEGEVCLFIGRRAKAVPAAEAWSVVAGCSLLNDISAGRFGLQDAAVLEIARSGGRPAEQMITRQMARAKGADGFCPIGPWLVPIDEIGVPFGEIEMETRVGENVVQRGILASQRFTAERCVEWVTRYMTLEPGDVLSIGALDQVDEFPMRDVDLAARGAQVTVVSSPQLGRLETKLTLADG
jgi:2-keto-4-pentenoate hydratase/2-oxohepta-3-ene-1,7-dioic acid hydratase in catechol pathway